MPFAPTLLHTSALPTLTANTSDQWVWADGRHFSVEETARACGVAEGSPLHRGLREGGGLTVRQATRALGEGVHVHVAKHVVGLALQDLLPHTGTHGGVALHLRQRLLGARWLRGGAA